MNYRYEQVVREVLRSYGTTLWGRSFDISSDDGMDEAVQFIVSLTDQLDDAYLEKFKTRGHPDRHAVL